MGDKVVGLRGKVIIDGREPLPAVVEVCERWLEMAKSGEINGISVVAHYFDECTGAQRAGINSYSMVGRLEEMKSRILKDLE